MAQETLDRQILREIRDPLKQSRAAVDECKRLEAALKALESSVADGDAPTQGRMPRAAPTKPRAACGANRDKALKVISDRPGVTVAELAAATGIATNMLYSTTRTLTERGRIERVSLPGDTFGFRLVPAADVSSSNARSNSGGAAEAA